MFRDKAKDGTTRLTGGVPGVRIGQTPTWWFGDSTDVVATFPDGKPANIGDILISTNGISQGDVYQVTKVYPSGNVDLIPTNNRWQSYLDTGWILVGATGAAAFQNSWTAYAGTPYGQPKYRRKNGIVYLDGLFKGGTLNSVLFTLPAGFRPNERLVMASVMSSINTGAASTGTAHTHPNAQLAGRVDITPDGNFAQVGATTTAFLSMAGMSFIQEA